jgi:hypothetical protein
MTRGGAPTERLPVPTLFPHELPIRGTIASAPPVTLSLSIGYPKVNYYPAFSQKFYNLGPRSILN